MRLLAAVATTVLLGTGSGTASTRPPEILFSGSQGGTNWNILAVRADGSGLRVVVAGRREGRLPTTPRVAPGGSRFVYDGPKGLVVAPVSGGAGTEVTTGLDLPIAWSRDGRWIAFARTQNLGKNDWHSYVYVVRPTGTGLRLIRTDAFGASWAPDSKRLAVGERSGGIVVVDLVGKAHGLPGSRCGSDPDWSPNGRWIAYTRCLGQPYHTGIVLQRPNGTGFRWLVRSNTPQGSSGPVWAPGSTRLAYTYARAVAYLEHTEIRMVTLAGKSLGNLDSDAGDHDEYARWSPNGRQIVFDRDAAIEPNGEADRLMIGDVASGKVRQLHVGNWRGSQTWRP
jgi:Tol biopolymer transport system component